MPHRIYLGCAALSGKGGWQEGAVAAAWKQVKALHERAMTGVTSAPALDAEAYATLTAYILRSNGASAGSRALSASTDVSIGSVTGKPQAPTSSGRD